MARLPKQAIFGIVVGWLAVAALMILLGWISYRHIVQPWEELECEVESSKQDECGTKFRVLTMVTFEGEEKPVQTIDTDCDFETIEDAIDALLAPGRIPCYKSPGDSPKITVFKEKAEKTDEEKRTTLILTVTPLLVIYVAAAVMFFVIVRLRAVFPQNPDDTTGGFLSAMFGSPVPPRRPPRVVPSRGISESDADAAIADVARTVDSSSTVCVVCLEDNTSKSMELPCTHAFHESCLKDCTLCRHLQSQQCSSAPPLYGTCDHFCFMSFDSDLSLLLVSFVSFFANSPGWMKGNPVCPCCSKAIAELSAMRNGTPIPERSDADEEAGLPVEALSSAIQLALSSPTDAVVTSSVATEADPIPTGTEARTSNIDQTVPEPSSSSAARLNNTANTTVAVPAPPSTLVVAPPEPVDTRLPISPDDTAG